MNKLRLGEGRVELGASPSAEDTENGVRFYPQLMAGHNIWVHQD